MVLEVVPDMAKECDKEFLLTMNTRMKIIFTSVKMDFANFVVSKALRSFIP